MKKLILLFIAMLCSWSIYAWERETIWPKGKMPHRQDHQIAAMTDEAGALTMAQLMWQGMVSKASMAS